MASRSSLRVSRLLHEATKLHLFAGYQGSKLSASALEGWVRYAAGLESQDFSHCLRTHLRSLSELKPGWVGVKYEGLTRLSCLIRSVRDLTRYQLEITRDKAVDTPFGCLTPPAGGRFRELVDDVVLLSPGQVRENDVLLTFKEYKRVTGTPHWLLRSRVYVPFLRRSSGSRAAAILAHQGKHGDPAFSVLRSGRFPTVMEAVIRDGKVLVGERSVGTPVPVKRIVRIWIFARLSGMPISFLRF